MVKPKNVSLKARSRALACFTSFSAVFFLISLLIFFPGSSAIAKPFTNGGPGTVLDEGTGLMWQKGDSYIDLKKGLNWYDALEYVDRKNAEKFGGHDDWRLPSMAEFNKVWDPNRAIESKDGEPLGLPDVFEAGGSYYLWSADERGLDNVWYFGLGNKENYFNLKDLADLDQAVKLVRSVK